MKTVFLEREIQATTGCKILQVRVSNEITFLLTVYGAIADNLDYSSRRFPVKGIFPDVERSGRNSVMNKYLWPCEVIKPNNGNGWVFV